MEEKNNGFYTAAEILPKRFSDNLIRYSRELEHITQEVVLRSGRPFAVETTNGRFLFSRDDCLLNCADYQSALKVTRDELKDTFMRVCSYSVHSFQSEINMGYVTMKGGLRVGVCGEAVVSDEKIIHIKNITSLNIRIAREHIGCSKEILDKVNPLDGVLICGAPSSGKTSVLRDIARVLSYSYKISLIDERNELSATSNGTNRNDIGMCDVYVGYPKSQAILQAVRSQSPDIIVVDEIGDNRDLDAVRYALYCGTSFIAAVHGETLNRPVIRSLLSTHAFSSTVMLKGRKHAGKVREILCSG